MSKTKLYLDNGYLNFEYLYNRPEPNIFCWGGRGTGKTYGVLEYCVERGIPFLYLRRTAKQTRACGRDVMNPFKVLNRDKGWNYHATLEEDFATFVDCDRQSKNGKWLRTNGAEPVGYGVGLQTMASLRSISLDEVDVMLLDEFVPELHERKIKFIGEAHKNAIETIQRNRELQGRPPVKCISFTNANTQRSDIIMEWGLLEETHKLFDSNEWIRPNLKNGQVCLIRLVDSPISKLKAETSLYKATAGTSFAKMAIDNEFAYDEPSRTGSINLKACKPICAVGEIAIYERKDTDGIYVTTHKQGTMQTYGMSGASLERFRRRENYLWSYYMDNLITFETYPCEMMFLEYFDANF